MKNFFFLLIAIALLPLQLFAQWPKNKPVKLLDRDQSQSYYKLNADDQKLILAQNTGLTASLLEIASGQVAPQKYPDRLRINDDAAKAETPRYKAYAVASWSDGYYGGDRVLVWVPRDENRHMPEDMPPLNDAGLFLVYKPDNSAGFAFLDGTRPAVAFTPSAPARLVGIFAVAYGPEKGPVEKYYLYEVYSSGGLIESKALLAGLQKETDRQRYKKHKFYMAQTSYWEVAELFKKELSNREAKKRSGSTAAPVMQTVGLLQKRHSLRRSTPLGMRFSTRRPT